MARINSSKDVERLRHAIQRSRDDLRPFRELRRMLVKEFAGAYYGLENPQRSVEEGVEDHALVNMMDRAVIAYMLHLAGGDPQVIVHANSRKLLPVAATIRSILNPQLRQHRFGDIIAQVVQDAYYMIGICAVGVDRLTGQPFAAPVPLDDWVQDMSAPRFSEAAFYGYKYRMYMDTLKRAARQGEFNRQAVAGIEPVRDIRTDSDGTERTQGLSTVYSDGHEVYRPFCYLWDIFIPDQQVVVTLSDQFPDGPNKPLAITEWDGDETGPCHQLAFFNVSDNSMPTSQASQILDLHVIVNDLVRKMGQAAMRQRTIVTYSGQEADGRRITDSLHDEVVRVDDPQSVRQLRLGGVDNQTHGFAIWLMGQLDAQGGNISSLAGLRPSADTFGQEQIVSQAASQRVKYMARKTLEFAERLIRDWGQRVWEAPDVTYNSSHSIAGTSLVVEEVVSPEDRRKINLRDYHITVEPYSMVYQGPEARAAKILQLTQFAMQAAPMLVQSGVQINFARLFDIIAEYQNLPELRDVLEISAGDTSIDRGFPAKSPGLEGEAPSDAGPTADQMAQSLMGMGGINNRTSSANEVPAA